MPHNSRLDLFLVVPLVPCPPAMLWQSRSSDQLHIAHPVKFFKWSTLQPNDKAFLHNTTVLNFPNFFKATKTRMYRPRGWAALVVPKEDRVAFPDHMREQNALHGGKDGGRGCGGQQAHHNPPAIVAKIEDHPPFLVLLRSARGDHATSAQSHTYRGKAAIPGDGLNLLSWSPPQLNLCRCVKHAQPLKIHH